MKLSVRKATPSDSKFLSWVLLTAAHSHLGEDAGLWNLIFPESETERAEYVEKLIVSKHNSFCRFSNYLIAEVDGRPASALAGFDPTVVSDENFLNALVDCLPESLLTSVLNRMAPYTTCLIEPDNDSWVIDMVATVPEFRRLGLSKTLLETTLRHGSQAGFKQAELLILIGNNAAQNAYETIGFEIVEEKKHPDFENALNCPGVARMIKPQL